MTIGGDASRPIEILDVEMEEEKGKVDGLIDVDKAQEIDDKDINVQGDALNDPATTILLSAPDQEGVRTLVEDGSAPFEGEDKDEDML